MKHLCIVFLLIAVIISATDIAPAQQIQVPRLSPKAVVTQTIGISDVTITYSRPGVKGRTIWGGLVPYDTLWRTGANEATTIAFGDTIRIQGNPVPPGSYSIATIPGRTTWTVIFNKGKDLWGTMGYKQEDDVLRITVTPEPAVHEERMSFQFTDVTDNSSSVVLRWEKLNVAFRIDVDTKELVLAKARKAIGWQAPMQAANYCLSQKTNMDEAMRWINISTNIEENYSNLRVKAQLMERTGSKKDAIAMMERAVAIGKGLKQPPFDLADMEKMLAEWKK